MVYNEPKMSNAERAVRRSLMNNTRYPSPSDHYRNRQTRRRNRGRTRHTGNHCSVRGSVDRGHGFASWLRCCNFQRSSLPSDSRTGRRRTLSSPHSLAEKATIAARVGDFERGLYASVRKACAGSTFAACRAGRQVDMNATTSRIAATVPNVRGSLAFTP
jgi:hypothetical protein